VEEEFLIGYARHHGVLRECAGDYEGDIVMLKLETMRAAVKAILTELQISSVCIRLPGIRDPLSNARNCASQQLLHEKDTSR